MSPMIVILILIMGLLLGVVAHRVYDGAKSRKRSVEITYDQLILKAAQLMGYPAVSINGNEAIVQQGNEQLSVKLQYTEFDFSKRENMKRVYDEMRKLDSRMRTVDGNVIVHVGGNTYTVISPTSNDNYLTGLAAYIILKTGDSEVLRSMIRNAG